MADEAVVRNLRNGGVVFNHNLSGDQRAELQTLVESLPGYPDCYVLQPHADVGEGEIELTAWGWLDRLTPRRDRRYAQLRGRSPCQYAGRRVPR